MHTNKKIGTVILSKEQQIVTRKLRADYQQRLFELRNKVFDLKSDLSFYSNFENKNPRKEL